MGFKEIIEPEQALVDYYADRIWVSNSMLGRVNKDPVKFTQWMNGTLKYPYTEDLCIGSYVHWHFLNEISEGGLHSEPMDIVEIDDFNARTNTGKEYRDKMIKEYPLGNTLTKSVMKDVKKMVDLLLLDPMVNAYIDSMREKYHMSVEESFKDTINYNIPDYGRFKVKIKGKLDIVWRDGDGEVAKITDLKTTYKMEAMRMGIWKFGLNRQAFHYSELCGLDLNSDVFDFLTIAKDDMACKVFKTNGNAFISGANTAWRQAMDKYIYWQQGDMLNLQSEVL